MIEERRLSFDHDYATDVVQKHKAYTGIKRALKEKGVRFQTPLDKMRIHWDSGTRTYNSAQDAAQELRRRGYSVETPGRSTTVQSTDADRKARLRDMDTIQLVFRPSNSFVAPFMCLTSKKGAYP
ncbi:hypothetical protein AAFF_G00407330 [Aldrovandia affinis]|uniref:Uncharacterized protein n=1 Tax=Aldrovandia affinis TaxID=143900 RepID=A0AAD7R3K2_9TELE|nr:hypothetical protein AAFF_G00407330 [Aldrovandia affinis]